jgi:peroxiredoxin Q/BCP
MLNKGDIVAGFALPDADGNEVRLSDLEGQYAVIYFYPKDDTSGCTKEALDFNQLKGDFEALGARIAGVSPDSVKSHAKFAAKHGLEITLLSDEQKSVIQAFGVWVEKKMYGKAYMGVDRSTFLIGPDGKIVEAWRGVKVPGHAAAVLKALKEHKDR